MTASMAVLLQQSSDSTGLTGVLFLLVFLAVCVAIIASVWIVFTKAGQPGWASIVPFYNMVVLCQIAGKPGWWFLLLCIPFVGFIFLIIVSIALAEKFGKGAGFGLGLAFLGFIFFPMLAWGDAQYHG